MWLWPLTYIHSEHVIDIGIYNFAPILVCKLIHLNSLYHDIIQHLFYNYYPFSTSTTIIRDVYAHLTAIEFFALQQRGEVNGGVEDPYPKLLQLRLVPVQQAVQVHTKELLLGLPGRRGREPLALPHHLVEEEEGPGNATRLSLDHGLRASVWARWPPSGATKSSGKSRFKRSWPVERSRKAATMASTGKRLAPVPSKTSRWRSPGPERRNRT